jgi:ParB family transcriptional regulator, chromosome partitioning protein
MPLGRKQQDQVTMTEDQPRPRLGRGLAALIGDSSGETSNDRKSGGQRRAPIEHLRPNPKNPRKNFAEAELEDLANSIREKGVIQPILVRDVRPDSYEIIAGERRWRAAQRASLHDVPIIVIEAGDKEALEIAIIENVQRTDLNALEEARGYQQLAAEFGYSHPDLAKVIGKSRSHVANTLRLLKLPETVQRMLIDGQISAGHARALLTVADADRMAKLIVAQGLTVRDIEKVAQSEAQKRIPETKQRASGKRGTREKDADTRALEKALADVLGLIVTIEHRGESGEVRIRYKSLEQLDALCRRLKT